MSWLPWAAVLAVVIWTTGNAQSLTPLPQGNAGIAAHYVDDVNIGQEQAVVFADDFEDYSSASNLNSNWNAGVYHHVTLVTDSQNVFAGNTSLQFRNPKQSTELSNTVARSLSAEQDILFLRYYGKYDPSFDVVGSSHNGAGMSASYFKNGHATPGVPADGYNKFLANYECWRGQASTPSPGELNVYIYHPEQRSQWGDHFFPTGTVMPNTSLPFDFGPDFVSRTDIVPSLGKWHCYELMVKANTPGKQDGRIGCWFDGTLIADFPNLRLRDTDTLEIDRFQISMHIKSNTVAETWKWVDNVVAATSYIGPMVSNNSIKYRPAGNTQQTLITDAFISGKTVSFCLSSASSVTADLYSIQGIKVKRLAHDHFKPGRYTVRWDGKDNHGRPAANGTYTVIILCPGDQFSGTIAVTR